jgi:hypothetical protein
MPSWRGPGARRDGGLVVVGLSAHWEIRQNAKFARLLNPRIPELEPVTADLDTVRILREERESR